MLWSSCREKERTREGVRKREKAAWGEFEGVDEESRRPTRSLKKLSKFLSALRRAPTFEIANFSEEILFAIKE